MMLYSGLREKKMELAIFDMDGTLFDTCGVNYEAYRKALEEENIALTEEYYSSECFGKGYRDFLPGIMKGNADCIERVHERKKKLYHECICKARMNRALFDYIDAVRKNCRIALVTTASARNVHEILEYFNVEDRFDHIMTQEEMKVLKPDPWCYVTEMKHFDAAPSQTVIFEDSDVGIEAALKSGASVMRVMKF